MFCIFRWGLQSSPAAPESPQYINKLSKFNGLPKGNFLFVPKGVPKYSIIRKYFFYRFIHCKHLIMAKK